MRTAQLALAVLCGFVTMLSIGVSEAMSQETLIRVCNRTNIPAAVAITAHPSPGNSAFVIRGWWIVNPGACRDTEYVPHGWAYFYAEANSRANIEWRGSDQRFCVTYPGPFERIISPQYSCSGNVLKSFAGYYMDVGTFTWNLN